jgi:hypothetical protein
MKALVFLVCLSAAAWPGDGSRYHEDFHYSYAQTPGGRLSVEDFNGSIEVTGWDQNTVDISGTKYAQSEQLLHELKIEASSSGNETRIRAVRPDGERHGNMGARFTIRVPKRTLLDEIRSSNGSVRVESVDGDARLHTSNGSVRLSNIRGNVEAETSNGGVEVESVNGNMRFHTSNGTIHAQDVAGAFTARTSNGGIHVHLRETQEGKPIEVSSSNGGIELQLDSARGNDVIASTSNGRITLRLPAAINANLSASASSNGSVRSDFDITVHGELSKHHIEGVIGSGGPKLQLTTSNGHIELLKI